jgi:hypothetical protein
LCAVPAADVVSSRDLRRVRTRLRAVRAEPQAAGLDDRYWSLVCYLIGLDDALSGGLLDGFQRWIVERHLATPTSPVRWPALVARIARPEHDGHRVWGAIDSIDAVGLLYDELDAYLTDRLDAAT